MGSGGGPVATGSAVPAASSGPAVVEEEKKEEKPEEKEDSEDEIVRILFDFQCFLWVNIILLHYLGFWRTLRLIYFTTYEEFVASFVRCEVMRMRVPAPCQIL